MLSTFKRRLILILSDPAAFLRRSACATFGILVALALQVPALTTNSEAASITTLFNANNGGSTGGAVYFDLTVGPNNLSITGLDTNTAETGVFPGFQVFTGIGTAFGNEGNAGFWSLAATGTLTGLGLDGMSPVALSSNVSLGASTAYGIALVMPAGAGHDYTGPTGFVATYANLDLALSFGTADNTPFTGGAFNPRTWNGTINYEVQAVPLPAAVWMFLSALGGLGLFGWRRKRLASA